MEFGEQINHPNVTESLRESLSTNPLQFTRSLYFKYRSSTDTPNLITASQSIEPIDKTLGANSEPLTSASFFNGTNIGRHVVDLLHPQQVHLKRRVSLAIEDMINKAEIEVSGLEDDYERQQALAQIILDLGWEGCSQFPDLTAVIENVEDEIIGDATKSQFLRPGMGFMLLGMTTAETVQAEIDQKKDIQNMSEAVSLVERGEQIIDWDAEFDKIQ